MRYQLVKPLPDLQAGALFDTEHGKTTEYIYRDGNGEEWAYPSTIVEGSDFFQPYDEPLAVVPMPQPRHRERAAGDPYWHHIKLTKPVNQIDLEFAVMDAIATGKLKTNDVLEPEDTGTTFDQLGQ